MDQTIALSNPFGKATTGKLGMWLFLLMDALTFIGILIGGLALRVSQPDWPAAGTVLNIPLTAFNTFLLICTSFTMVMALNSIQKGNQKGLVRFLTLTILGGLTFLGIQVSEYTQFIVGGEEVGKNLALAGIPGTQFLPMTSIYGATFFATTSFHGLHVLSGVIYLSFILGAAMKGSYSETNFDRVEIAALFWHFVDLIWILVFTLIYLL